jgi:hypothetical protein
MWSYGNDVTKTALETLVPYFHKVPFDVNGCLSIQSLTEWKKQFHQQILLQRFENCFLDIEASKGNTIIRLLRAKKESSIFFERDPSKPNSRRQRDVDLIISDETLEELLRLEEWKKPYLVRNSRKDKTTNTIAHAEDADFTEDDMSTLVRKAASHYRRNVMKKANDLFDQVILLKVNSYLRACLVSFIDNTLRSCASICFMYNRKT